MDFRSVGRNAAIVSALILALAAANLFAQNISTGDDTTPENIVFISSDGLSANHMPCYGYDRNTSPNICGLENSVVYKHAYSTSVWERLAIPSMMTGKYPHRVNVVNSHTPLNKSYTTIAEELRNNDYRTVMRMGNRFFPEETNADQGFDSYEEIGYSPDGNGPLEFEQLLNTSNLYYRLHVVGAHNPYSAQQEYYNYSDYRYVDEVNLSISSQIRQKRARFRETENVSAFDNISDRQRQIAVDNYDENIRALDKYVGSYVEKLKKQGEYEDSLIIVTSTYGMSFDDYGDETWNHMNTNPSTARVPLIVKYPESAGSKKSNKLVSITDPFKIILNEVGAETSRETESIDPRKQTRDRLFTYTMRGSSIVNKTHFITRSSVRDETFTFKYDQGKYSGSEFSAPDLQEQLVNFTDSYRSKEYNRTDFGYEDIAE